tara:strand:- start:1293 stop:8828 length:7536 start_codon:yes stop_codon:yes gene_type:complete
MPQNTNLNSSPYFDDFEELKNYQRVLFKPGLPIQSRELTTLQSILQNQVEKFGKHFFKEGAVVIPGQIAYDSEYTAVQIDDAHLGIPVSLYLENLKGKKIKGETSGVTAKVETYITNRESTKGAYTLYIKYQSSSDSDFSRNIFADGENLLLQEDLNYSLSSIRSGASFATTLISNATATGAAAKIAQGVYFIRGFFVTVADSTVILDQYSNTPSYRVGLLIQEELITASSSDNDLYDNARGFSNFAAPGADRLKISTSLIKKSLTDLNDENFVELMRIENGILKKFVKSGTNPADLIRDELARRTFDESGHYYIKPFPLSPKECLNDRIGNNGAYYSNQLTQQGNTPTDDLMCLSIGPGKAYVKGYEIETLNTTTVDVPKPRTTAKIVNESLPFSVGRQIELNNVYGSPLIGVSTSSHVKLFDQRTSTVGTPNGNQIGVARVYDMKLKNVGYADSSTIFESSLYDIQTFTYLQLNTKTTVNLPAYIVGQNSNASGYAYTSVNNKSQITLYQVAGQFQVGEEFFINGVTANRSITEVEDYGIEDVKQLVSNDMTNYPFTADPILSLGHLIAPVATQFTVSAASGAASTISSPSASFVNSGIKTGDIIQYSLTGNSVPTYNRVTAANAIGISLAATTDVQNVCSGALPTSDTSVNDLFKVSLEVRNNSKAFLFSELTKPNVASVDTNGADILFKKSYSITVASNAFSGTLETDADLTLEPFDEEDYNLSFKTSGKTENLTNQKLTVSGRTITLSGLDTASGAAILTVTWKKVNVKPKAKVFKRATTYTINKSNKTQSGTGLMKLNDGLTYDTAYGNRVQDERISLGACDVAEVLAVLESSSTSDPQFPILQLTNLNSNILNAVVGETIVGRTSGASAVFVATNGSDEVSFVSQNENAFEIGEEIIFEETNVSGVVQSFTPGDRDIRNNFEFDPGQRLDYVDFSALIRKSGTESPTRRLTVVYNNFIIDAADPGDFVTVNSYERKLYGTVLPIINGINSADIIDLRPRVTSTISGKAPWEFDARVFVPGTSSSSHVVAKDKSFNVSYEYYLGRIDKLFLSKEGIFTLSQGVPSELPKLPNTIDNALEVATIKLPPYVYNTGDINLTIARHKRFRMKDIVTLENRIKNIEYYTSLSLLEVETSNMSLRDPQTNLERFKSGFFVDNFKSATGGDINNSQYKASIDAIDGRLRPQHYTTSIDLLLGSEAIVGAATSSNPSADFRFAEDLGDANVKRIGDVVCLNYDDTVYLENNFATRIENVNPFAVVNWIGQVELNPGTDTWIETRRTSATYDIEGSFNATMGITGADSNTGLSPIDWGSWETTWTGSSVDTGPTLFSRTDTEVTGRSEQRGHFQRGSHIPLGRGIPITTTTNFLDTTFNFREQTTTTTTNQTRQGIQFRVGERFDTTSLGDKVVNTEVIATMRSRNIEFVTRRLKPNTRLYPFFDNIDMSRFVVPKLIEITMISGTFGAGEIVEGSRPNSNNDAIRFRLANQNHKYGPYNNPDQVYKQNPYDPASSISSTYSSTTSLLNVDTASLELQSASGFYGYITTGMKLIGQSSGAIAQVSAIRLITDKSGTLIGSLFLPDPTIPSAPSFNTGTKTFTLSSSPVNSTISGFTDSSGEANFTSSGTLQTVESSTLRTRNADVQRIPQSADRTLSEDSSRLVIENTFANRSTTQTRWVDPLAQSFEVPDINGVFLTKCDVYFQAKDTNELPVTLQVRTLQTGLPTQEILPFGECILDPDQVVLSADGSKPTTFTFPSPVYCEGGGEFALVLLSASNEYFVYISRMGEEDITTVNAADSEKIIVSQQPLLGSLFKSQNGATWDPSQLEDLKFNLYRANFTATSGRVNFYNPDLDIGNRQIVSLANNPVDMLAYNAVVGLGKSLTSAEQAGLTEGTTIYQQNNPNFSANLNKVLGAIGVGSDLTITNGGSGFSATSVVYSGVPLISQFGKGTGATVNLTVDNRVAVAATVSIGGTGYSAGDVLTVDAANTGGFGKDLRLTIPNNVGVISAFNTLVLNNIQGKPKVDSSSAIVYVGGGGTSVVNGAPITFLQNVTDGLHFRVRHSNHGMYSAEDQVILSGVEADVKPEKLTSTVDSTSTEDMTVTAVGIFTSFENVEVNSSNPGYAKIGNEIIKYTGVTTTTSTINNITRSIDNTKAGDYEVNDKIFKYELNGVSLRRVNTSHSFLPTDDTKYPIDVDHYWIKVGVSSRGVDRATGNANGFPELFFRENKSGGSYDQQYVQVSNSYGPMATQNIPFNIVRPNVATLLPEGTEISAKLRTFSGNSPDGNLKAYVDQGYEDISLNSNNYLSTPRVVASKTNELAKLIDFPGRKSFTLQTTLTTDDPKVSPFIDLDRVNMITIMDRLNSKIDDYATDRRVNSIDQDPSAAIYLSKIVNLEKSADGLKVMFDAYKHSTNDIRVLYRIFRIDAPPQYQLFELFPGFENLDQEGRVIDPAKNNGKPDRRILSSSTESDYKEYEFNAKDLPQFNGFQIKIVMTGTNYAYVPKIRDLRAIASI